MTHGTSFDRVIEVYDFFKEFVIIFLDFVLYLYNYFFIEIYR